MKRTLLLALVPFLSGCGLVLVEGPAPGWETANPEDLETMASLSPCTNSKTLPRIDLLLAGLNAGFGAYNLLIGPSDYGPHWYTRRDQSIKMGIASLVWASAQAFSAWKGTQKVNNCRAFNARLLEEGRGDEQASHEWLDELFPLPDLGVTGLDPVFGVPINQDH